MKERLANVNEAINFQSKLLKTVQAEISSLKENFKELESKYAEDKSKKVTVPLVVQVHK